MVSCPTCSGPLARKDSVSCGKCSTLFHLACVNITLKDVEYLREKKKKWVCKNCESELKAEARSDNCLASPARVVGSSGAVTPSLECKITQDKEPSLTDVFNLIKRNEGRLQQLIDEQKEFRENIERAMEFQSGLCNELSEKLERIEVKLAQDQARIASLEENNLKMFSKLNALELKINNIEQGSLGSSLEIHGVPVKPNENCRSIVSVVGRSLGVDISPNDIFNVYRPRPRASNDGNLRDPPIVVQLNNCFLRDELISARKVKRNLSSAHLNWEGPEVFQVYINERLTFYNKTLYNSARDLKKQNKIKYLWVKNGKVLMRKADGAPVIVVNTPDDLKCV